MQTLKTFLLFLVSLLTWQVHANQTRYVTDDLELYTRSGPTPEFRIVGRVNTGQKVTLVEVNEETQFSKIKTDDNKLVWIENKFLSDKESAKEKLINLQKTSAKKLEEAQEKLELAQSQIKQNQDLLNQLEELTQEVNQLKKENEVITQQNSTYKNEFLYEFFFAGGSVALIGCLLGFLFSKYGGKKRRNLF